MTEKEFVLIYDTDLRRPGCVLIQAAYGCDPQALGELGFESRDWLLVPTPGMRKLSGNRGLWDRVVAITANARDRADGRKP